MKRTMLWVAMVIGCSFAAFGETWKDSKGITWEFDTLSSGGYDEAKIIGATPAPKGALTMPTTVSDGYITYKVTVIGEKAFYENSGITSVVIPSSVTEIEKGAFRGCANLASVTFKGDTPTFDFGEVFEDTMFQTKVVAGIANDDMSNPRKLFGVSGATKDENFVASVVPGELITKLAPSPQMATKWYEWTAPKSGTVWFWTPGATFDTFLGVCTSDDTPADIVHNCGFSGGVSQASFVAVVGTKYRIYVGGVGAKYLGSYTLKWRMGTPVALTFDPCGGTMDMGVYGGDVVPVPKNTAVSVLPTASKEYYTLAGWYTKKSGGTKVTASTKFAKGTKLYAHWAKKKFKVTVTKEAGGKSVKGSGSYAWGTKVKLSATAKPGYVFRSWGADMAGAYYEASCNAFPKFNSQCRKNLTPTVTVPKNSPLSYYASFVKKTEDTIWFKVTGGSTTLYAEDGAGGFVNLYAHSFSYPKVTTSKLPAGIKFSLLPPPTSPYSGVIYDSEYKLEIVNPDKVPAGKNVIKITAKNRSGKTATKSIVVWGKNRTQAIGNGALSVDPGFSDSVKAPNEIYVGVKYTLANLGISAESGWKVTKIDGLPAGITWDAKSQKLKGYTTKTGLYTLKFTVAKGKTTYTATATFKVLALPAKIVGTFYGYTPNEYGFFSSQSLKVTASVTSAGKVSAKIGGLSFSCNGLTYNAAGNKFNANMKSSVAKSKTVTYTRSVALEFDPVADYSENSLNGAYYEYTTKKTSGSVTEELVAQHEIFGRRNVLSCDANGNLVFEGAGVVSDALTWALFNLPQPSPVTFADGVTATISSNCDGTVKLAGTYYGKTISESAVVWYEPVNATIAYIRIYSFNLGMQVTYKVTIVNDSAGPYVDTVDPPAVPAG